MICGFLHQQFYSEIEFSLHTNKNKSDQTNKQSVLLYFASFFPPEVFNCSQEGTFLSHKKQAEVSKSVKFRNTSASETGCYCNENELSD